MSRPAVPQVKVVVWDLDETVWDGALVEGSAARPRTRVVDTIRELDRRGVLQSVASKNDAQPALAALRAAGIDEYFLYPQISWDPKSDAVERIAASLNVGRDTVLLVDDDPFERAEVAASHPDVRCVDSAHVSTLLARDDIPREAYVAEGATTRRELYRREERRRDRESTFEGTKADFLASLDLHLRMRRAAADDLDRAAELTIRTNQLNTTGVVFSHEELVGISVDGDHAVLMLDLRDHFGDYGTIGLVVVRRAGGEHRIRLFLLSCRVMGRNLVPAIVRALADDAARDDARLLADFVPTEVNRPMYVAYRFAGFRDVADSAGTKKLELTSVPAPEAAAHVHMCGRDATTGLEDST